MDLTKNDQRSAAPDESASNFGIDHSSHHLIEWRIPPDSLIRMRQELLNHPEILNRARSQDSFGTIIGSIAADLDILLDGDYTGSDIERICDILYKALAARREGRNQYNPHNHDQSLINVEITEHTDGKMTIDEKIKNIFEGPGVVDLGPTKN